MKKIFVSDLKNGDSVFGELFAIKSYKKTATRNNRPYIDITLSDKTGSIKGKIWSDDMPKCESAEESDVVSISATVEDFNGPQLRITNMTKVDKYDLSDFQPTTDKDIDKMFAEVVGAIKGVKNPKLKKLLQAFLDDKDAVKKYKKSAAGLSVHHAYLGGLLEHTLEILKFADSFYQTQPKLNKDLLTTGIILHDIGKIYEYDINTTIIMTTQGRLLGHIFLGAELVKKYGEQTGISENLLDEVIHLILSHHGKYDFGSPVLPKTPEAIALSRLDDVSAKLNTAFGILAGQEDNELFTAYHRILETELYRSPYADELLNEDIPF